MVDRKPLAVQPTQLMYTVEPLINVDEYAPIHYFGKLQVVR